MTEEQEPWSRPVSVLTQSRESWPHVHLTNENVGEKILKKKKKKLAEAEEQGEGKAR